MGLIAQNTMAGLTSHLGGFTNHGHRHTTSSQLLGKIGERRLILAKPTYIQSAHQTLWEIGTDLALQPLTELLFSDQHVFRERFEQIKGDILARIEESEGHAAMTDMYNALIIPNLSSVLVNHSTSPNAPEFVVINWGCLEDGKDPPPPPRGLVSVRIRVRSAHSGVPLGKKRILIVIGDSKNEEVPYFTDDFGEVTLGRKEKGANIFIRQDLRDGTSKQLSFVVGPDEPSVLDFPWRQEAYIRLLLPPPSDRSTELQEVLWEDGQGTRSRLTLPASEEAQIPGLNADDNVRLFSLMNDGEQNLANCTCVEGENIIDLTRFKLNQKPMEDIPAVDDPPQPESESEPDPVQSDLGRLRIVWNNFLNRPISSLRYGLHATSEERELNRLTNEEGIDEFEKVPFGEHHIYTRWKGQDWLIHIQHERDIEEHVIQLRRHWPWWSFILAGAILLLAVFMFWRVPYRPEVRLVDASTWAPIPAGLVEYQNFDGQIVSTTAGNDGLVRLIMGERPLYKKVFQLNPETPATAKATGYLDCPSQLHHRTWYWTQDWPLAPINKEDVADLHEEIPAIPEEGIVDDVSRVLSTGDRPWENCRPQRASCSGFGCIEFTVCSMDPSIILVQKGSTLVSHFAVLNGESHTESLAPGAYEIYRLAGNGWDFGSTPPVSAEPDGCVLSGYFNIGGSLIKFEDRMTESQTLCIGLCGDCTTPVVDSPADIRDVL